MSSKSIRISQAESQNLVENLQALLKSHKLTDNGLAQALGLPAMTISRLTSGDTTDPRISTLTLISDYFGITVDALIKGKQIVLENKNIPKENKPYFVPVLDWDTAAKIDSIKEIDLGAWEKWQPVLLEEKYPLSEKAFAVESRPTMYPHFSHGTIFIIDPDSVPSDGDMVLVKIKDKNDLTLRNLIIDPPNWELHSITSQGNVIQFSKMNHIIIGVVILTIFHNKKLSSG